MPFALWPTVNLLLTVVPVKIGQQGY